jgi:UbiD family decarboxylase
MSEIITQAPTTDAPELSTDLREWIRRAEAIGYLERLSGAHWDIEIGGLTEMVCLQSAKPRALLFDQIPDYPPTWRVLSNVFAHQELAALTLGLPYNLSPAEFVQAWRRKSKQMQLTPVREVTDAPFFANTFRGADIDLWRFPTPRWHEEDGGRYIGAGDVVVTRDPESGSLNVGTYRMMIQDRDKVGLYISPGHHGRIHREKYFARGEPMPVAAAFGMDALVFGAGGLGLPGETNEFEWVGAVRSAPLEVVPGPVTGLPIPVDAEIVVEGYVHPGRTLAEGPFGEFTGYYASGTRDETYVQVEALYHRDDPIMVGSPPMRPPSGHYQLRWPVLHALIWDALDAAGVPDVRGVNYLPFSGYGMLVVAITQRYAGHAKQAAMIAAQNHIGAFCGRYVVVVDDDIDPYDTKQVLWALWTRSDPAESLDFIHNCWSTPLDPRIPPHKRAAGDFTNSRLIIDATRPFHWRNQFPPAVVTTAELQAKLRQKWGNELFA